MRLSQRSKLHLNSYLALSLAFLWPLVAATSAQATSPTPAQQVASLQQDLQTYTQQYSAYTGHYQTYAPSRINELNAFASALTPFSSAVSEASSALQADYTAVTALQIAQANVAAVPVRSQQRSLR